MARVFVGLGTNLGDRLGQLKQALCLLRGLGTVRRVSSLYETEPVGYAGQPWFLNAACEMETDLSPLDLLSALKDIEHHLGRVPTRRNGPRTIDLDILLYDERQVELPDLKIPHPRMHQRRFVLEPLAEIAPDAVHPRLGKTARELLQELQDGEVVRKYAAGTGWHRTAEEAAGQRC
ncbi:MAG: 2-amino-4-hydroxy-6-hydroxymethyldihydropteridine diphosphokinase [Bacteroidetes bacterium]|nr:2-amino-4-hydroxy-6-hydroxymethyldihydropteridine diphosphokinase [Bacteroidota bacterium]MCL5025688.1 2-amino-4-hydroxy-6-hydroxymethyldihydropteridine diphosphokinase [Chloroflexota bacterium]